MLFSYGKGKKPMVTMEKDYILSGDWKCVRSPTGGHWWNCNLEPSICKICGKVKLYPR
jgi:hypothetical protein